MSAAKDWFNTLPPSTATIDIQIGEGDSSLVYKATSEEGKTVAVKIQEESLETIEQIYAEFLILEEMKGLPQLETKHFPEFLGAYRKISENSDPSQIWFVFEYLEGIPLRSLLQSFKNKRKLSEDSIAFILQEVCVALKTLHEQNIIHRDIKGSNIHIERNGQIKVLDFGIATKIETPPGKTIGTLGSPYWIAPEVIYSSDQEVWYDTRADVWSLGILAIELSEYNPPLSKICPSQAIFQIIQNPPPSLTSPHEWSQNFNDFISECLVKNPDHRPWSCEIVEHPFLKEFNVRADEIRTILSTLVNEIIDADEDKTPQENIKEEFYESSIKSSVLKLNRKTMPVQILPHDLATMSRNKLTEEAVVRTLSERFIQGNIYTYVGDILVLINPFGKEINSLEYCPRFASRYTFNTRSNNAPHIYGVGDKAYQDMLHHKEPQQIIFSGETCSGKTFAAKQLLTHLVNWTSGDNNELKDKVLSISKILDAFCNASTVFNPNSTRSVQYFELNFTNTGTLVGWKIWNYCLEKWRITDLPYGRNQTNFHIFHWLSSSEYFVVNKNEFEKYNYIPLHSANTCEERSLQFNAVHKAFQTLSFTEEQIQTIIDAITGIILLGEIIFETITESEEAETLILNQNVVEKVSSLFKIKSKKLSWALTNYCVIQSDEIVRAHTNYKESVNLRDGLARGIYSRLVDWIINAINEKSSGFGRLISREEHVIAMIDFPGFECYIKDNNFEQFTINLINEQIQFIYNHRIFMLEQQDNILEEIGFSNYVFHENSDLLDGILAKSGGFLKLLDNSTKKCNEESKNNLLNCIRTKLKSRFIRTVNENELKISHYSGLVKYNIMKFPEKNRHYLSPELIEVMRQSSNPIISELFKNKFTKTGNLGMNLENISKLSKLKQKIFDPTKGQYSQSKESKSPASILRNSCFEIFMKLTQGSEHFVRCIRSNLKFEPNSFDSNLVKYQIRALGLVESIKIRQKGYSKRLNFSDFLRRYKFLAFDHDEMVEETKDNCKLLLLRLKMDGWTLGKTKVFLKYYNEEYLARLYEERIHRVIKVQSTVRAFLARNRKQKLNPSSIQPRVSTIEDLATQVCEQNEQEPVIKEQKTPPKKFKTLIRSLSSFSETYIPNSDDESKKSNQVADAENKTLLKSSACTSSKSPVKSILKTFENQDQTDYFRSNAIPLTGRCFPVSPKNIQKGPGASAEKPKDPEPSIINPMVEFTNVSNRILSNNINNNNFVDRNSEASDTGPYNFQAMLRKTNRNLAGNNLEPNPTIYQFQSEKHPTKENSTIPVHSKSDTENHEKMMSQVQTVKLAGNLVLEGLAEDL